MENEQYARLMSIESVDNLSSDELLEIIGELIDYSDDLGRIEGTDRAYEWCDKLGARNPSPAHIALLEYFRANLWMTRGHIKEKEWYNTNSRTHASQENTAEPPTIDDGNPWGWEQPERQKAIVCLRRCINAPGFKEIDDFRRCQIYTNLANQLNTAGRPVDAIEYWDRALSEHEMFGMALGNKGYGLLTYAKAMYDQSHRAIFLKLAYDLLNTSLSDKAYYESMGYHPAMDFFKGQIQWIKRVVQPKYLAEPIKFGNFSMGSSKTEISYRQWCLNNKLFLNPLNDVTNDSVANHDILVLPSYITARENPPSYLGFFNQIKQEFSSARWLLYEGIHPKGTHFSDKGVFLYDTLDYSSYSLAAEKIKIAYRVIYSLFDKIGYFLNDYMQLRIKKVYFRSVWYEKGDTNSRVISSKFLQSKNWPFRGLFWLSKDLYDDKFATEMEPDAKALSEIRNHLEHKYLKVHEILAPKHTSDFSEEDNWIDRLWEDQLAYSISRQDFENKTLRLLKLARAALIYLCLGMRSEEQFRQKEEEPTGILPVTLGLYKDDRKR